MTAHTFLILTQPTGITKIKQDSKDTHQLPRHHPSRGNLVQCHSHWVPPPGLKVPSWRCATPLLITNNSIMLLLTLLLLPPPLLLLIIILLPLLLSLSLSPGQHGIGTWSLRHQDASAPYIYRHVAARCLHLVCGIGVLHCLALSTKGTLLWQVDASALALSRSFLWWCK